MKYLLEKYRKTLSIGQSFRTHCPHCSKEGNDKALSIIRREDHLSAFCFRCKEKGYLNVGKPTLAERQAYRHKFKAITKEVELPSDFTLTLPEHAKKKLIKYGIDFKLLLMYSVGYSKYIDALVYPLYDLKGNLKGVQYRSVVDRPDFPKYITKGIKPPYVCENENKSTLCLTEDVLSAIKVSTYTTSMSLLGTSLKKEHLKYVLDNKFKKVVIWLDNDNAGQTGAKKIAKQLAMFGVNVSCVFSGRDPKDAWHSTIKEKLL